jgi:hypothetical protein
MKKALLLASVLLFTLPCFAQVADRAPAHPVSSNAAPRGAHQSWVHVGAYDALDSGYSFGTSGSASAFSRGPGGGVTVYGASAAWTPSVKETDANWTFMQFGDPAKIGPAAFNGTPSLGAIAREAREAKSQQPPQAEKPLKVKMDGNGALVVVPQKK